MIYIFFNTCNIPVFKTNNPQLLVITNQNYANSFIPKQIAPFNTNLSYLNTKFVYLKFTVKRIITKLYADITNKQYEFDKQLLPQKLTLASYLLSEFAYVIREEPGYTAIKTEEIIYLQKCTPINVNLDIQAVVSTNYQFSSTTDTLKSCTSKLWHLNRL